jgi:condensin complex subunit 3
MTANNAFTRFDTAISRKFEKQLEDFSEEEYRKLEELKELFEFLDNIIPEDDDFVDVPKKKGNAARKRCVRNEATVPALISVLVCLEGRKAW